MGTWVPTTQKKLLEEMIYIYKRKKGNKVIHDD